MNILEQIESIDQTFRPRLEKTLNEVENFERAERMLKMIIEGKIRPEQKDFEHVLYAFKIIGEAIRKIPGYKCKFKKYDSEYEITWDRIAIANCRFEYLRPTIEGFKKFGHGDTWEQRRE